MSEFASYAQELKFEDVLYEKKDGVATVTLNRPDTYNCYRTRTLKELILAFQDASWDDSVVAIVYTGAGTRAFCTGGDVREYSEIYTKKPRDYWKYMGLFRAYLESILHAGKPSIARLNGMAVGGGNESQLACDLTVMAEHAYVGQVGTSVGSVACGGATQWLPLVVGDKRAREMLLLNPRIPARKALEWGLVNSVAPSVAKDGAFVENPTPEQVDLGQKKKEGWAIDLSKLDAAVADLVAKLKEKFVECTRYTRIQTNTLKDFVWGMTVAHAQDWLSTHFGGIEPYEGMQAFVEKRKADYARVRRSEFLHGPPEKACRCGAKGLPEDFAFCGKCGNKL
ncbi:MAG: enoyl-CoA hydratase/isomerase family protein [Planctomycetes bacterium]|nr:enoyl-CoA hydratase/isomerase family protein [Planctomycetota bacterium]